MSPCKALLAAADSTRITATEFRTLAVIAKGIGRRADIAKGIGKTVPTVARAIAKLVKMGWVERQIISGKASVLTICATRIMDDTTTHIASDTPKAQTRITHDPTTRIIGATRITGVVDKKQVHIRNARAPAHHQDNITTISQDNPERLESSGESVSAFALTTQQTEKPSKRGTRITADWKPSAESVRMARQLGIVNGWGENTLAQFIDYWIAVPGAKGVKLDWDATYRNALRTEMHAQRHKPREYGDNKRKPKSHPNGITPFIYKG